MPLLNWIGQHRLWALGTWVTVLVAVAAAGVWFFGRRSPGTRLGTAVGALPGRSDQQVVDRQDR